MTPSERERGYQIYRCPICLRHLQGNTVYCAGSFLEQHERVRGTSVRVVPLGEAERAEASAASIADERNAAEAAARKLYRSLADLVNWGHGTDAPDDAVRAWRDAQVVLAEQSPWGGPVYPSFSGEEGTER